jgi:formate hydrogenlyase subunit 3/multisubunit Na+/H+ antiporter MnhD subunit
MRPFYGNGQTGGAALEYIVVSVFGLLLAVAAIAIVGQATKDKLASVEQKLGIQLKLDELNPFN